MPTNSVNRWLLIGLLLFVWWNSKGGSFAPAKVTAAIYVYEKDNGTPPAAVLSGISKANASGIVATTFDKDTTDGSGEVPEQYKVPRAAAIEAGLPALVVMAGDKVVRIVKAPTTEEQITEAVK